LRAAWSLTRSLLVVSGRLTWDARGLTGRPLGDGLLTRTGTFQKFYEQAELASWIENTLDVHAHAAAPGIFYVFRDPSAAQQFLATRVHVYRPRVHIDPHEVYEQHKDRLAPLLEFLTAHARTPRPGELTPDQEADLHDAFPRVGRAVQLLHHVTEAGHWDRIAAQRRAELLIYIALSRFGHRPRFSQLPPTLAADIRTLFGTYQKACAQADRLLLAAGDQTKIYISARSSRIGKQTPSALYIHRDALAELPPLLQVYEGCARVLAGTIPTANMIKLSVAQPQVSYLTYPGFVRDAHPILAGAVTVNLSKLTVEWRDYTQSENPPLLHRKEEFLGVDDPRRPLYERLTRAETRAGLYEHPEHIGTVQGWQATLEQASVRLRGHRLQRRTAPARPPSLRSDPAPTHDS
jgi:DNA phosphorothioation-associated putative methyltransferase